MLVQFLAGNFDLTQLYFWVVALLIAITFHEAAHAYVADLLGDYTARYLGRVTLNPIAHLDPIGTLLILVSGFGWGKPVPFNPAALKNPVTGAALISLAGPLTNFLIALLVGQLVRFDIQPTPLWATVVLINLMLGLFNLIPVFPLDGEKVLSALLPASARAQWAGLQQYGIILLIAVIFTVGPLLTGVVSFLFQLISGQRF